MQHMLQTLRWDHIWNVRINLARSEAQALFQPMGLRPSTASSTMRSERSSSGLGLSPSVSLQTTCMGTSEVRSTMCSELHSWGKCGSSQHFSMTCGTGSSHFSCSLQRNQRRAAGAPVDRRSAPCL